MAINQILVPDIGNFKDVEIIEVAVKAGDNVNAEDTLVTLETDKAAMEVPAPFSGVVKALKVKLGDKVSEGVLIALIETGDKQSLIPPSLSAAEQGADNAPVVEPVQATSIATPVVSSAPIAAITPAVENAALMAHASPSIRRFARELGVNMTQIKGSGEKSRIIKQDVLNFVKSALAQPHNSGGNGLQVAEMPMVDYVKFGAIESQPLSRIKKLSGAFLHRNWVSIPHVTQFDEADITELEAFRKQLNVEYAGQGVKITPLTFMLRAVVEALQHFPEFNSSLDGGGENLIIKKYFHIGVAVDTTDGLVVPVLRDVNQKGILQLAKELSEISARARDKKISAAEMQGGCFTISSLGGIGGTKFTPIINAPEVAILGVSRASMKAVWKNDEFVPRLMLPLALSYDHRVIDGAAGARFSTYLTQVLADVRRLAL